MLELHIWGPGFALPSIDVECLATIHYLRCTLPDGTWCAVASSNPNLNPFQRLPALRQNSLWVAGFDNIKEYLSSGDGGRHDLDAHLTKTEKADCDAYTAFLYSRGVPLLDLSLYVSSENYTHVTRSVLSDLLSWPQSWTVPQQLRDQARSRTEHLGLSALDVDISQDNNTDESLLTNKIPKSLRKSRTTVSALLGHNAQRTRFRLDAVIDEFLEPLEARLARDDWLVAEQMSSVDCLAIAIISLMQSADFPQGWLKDALSTKYSHVGTWAAKHAAAGYSISAGDTALSDASIASNVPLRREPTELSWQDRGMLAIEAIISSLPVLRWGHEHRQIPVDGHDLKVARQSWLGNQEMYAKLRQQQRVYSQVVFGCISMGSLLSGMIHLGVVTLPHFERSKPVRRSFGEAGAILGL